MKRVLMIAYHFPPLAGSSGIQRTLRFAKYLPEFGWTPMVLTAHPIAYEQTSPDQLGEIPAGTVVVRAPALNTARHLSIKGRYPQCLALPDRWATWWLGAILPGLWMIRQHRPDLIWSTYPIATAHKIGGTLHRLTGLPWVADFRDPMVEANYPRDPVVRESYRRIEAYAVNHAALSVCTSPGNIRLYSERYPHRADRLNLIENGYDEECFEGLAPGGEPLNPGKLTLLHSGIAYPSERNPTHFFAALRRLRETHALSPERFVVRFRAPAHEAPLLAIAEQQGVRDFIEIAPPVPYRDALAEMMRADLLLIMQAGNCNDQIPAKFYEYLRAGRPILGLTDPRGDTARALAAAGVELVAPLDDTAAIAALLARITDTGATPPSPSATTIQAASRRNRTARLAEHFDALYARKASA